MSNAMKYIRSLEAAGFERDQAEAQVQMVLDAIEGDLATKSDFLIFQERIDSRMSQFHLQTDSRMTQFQKQIDSRLLQFHEQFQQQLLQFQLQGQAHLTSVESRFDRRFIETELRLVTRLGFLIVSTATIAVTLLVWLIKI